MDGYQKVVLEHINGALLSAEVSTKSREMSLVITKLQEAKMWLEQITKKGE